MRIQDETYNRLFRLITTRYNARMVNDMDLLYLDDNTSSIYAILYLIRTYVEQYTKYVIMFIFQTIYLRPLLFLYFYGSSIHGIGFWGGMSPTNICAQLTHTDPVIWNNSDYCDDILMRQFDSFFITMSFFVYAFMLYVLYKFLTTGFSFCVNRCCTKRKNNVHKTPLYVGQQHRRIKYKKTPTRLYLRSSSASSSVSSTSSYYSTPPSSPSSPISS